MESFYSIFQCYTLYNLIRLTKKELRAERWVSYGKGDVGKVSSKISNWAKAVFSSLEKNGIRGEAVVAICQNISNRYFPKLNQTVGQFIYQFLSIIIIGIGTSIAVDGMPKQCSIRTVSTSMN